jgi:hypothetical protein
MLCVNSYDRNYINECRSRIATRVSAYQRLVSAARTAAGASQAQIASAIAAFEPVFFSGMVFVLDGYFVHRSRTIEGKDGNPLNEVRVLYESMRAAGPSPPASRSSGTQPHQ